MNNLFNFKANKTDIAPSRAKRVEDKQRGKHTPTSKVKDIDWDSARKLCGMFCTQREVASFLGIAAETLYYRLVTDGIAGSWSEFFEANNGVGKISLRRAQYQKAVEEKDTRMLIWLGKQYLGQADKNIVISDNLDEEKREVYNLDELETQELETMERILEKVERDKADGK